MIAKPVAPCDAVGHCLPVRAVGPVHAVQEGITTQVEPPDPRVSHCTAAIRRLVVVLILRAELRPIIVFHRVTCSINSVINPRVSSTLNIVIIKPHQEVKIIVLGVVSCNMTMSKMPAFRIKL